ncbi:hypothetical protein QQG55_22385 [Brugia pahangi]
MDKCALKQSFQSKSLRYFICYSPSPVEESAIWQQENLRLTEEILGKFQLQIVSEICQYVEVLILDILKR